MVIYTEFIWKPMFNQPECATLQSHFEFTLPRELELIEVDMTTNSFDDGHIATASPNLITLFTIPAPL